MKEHSEDSYSHVLKYTGLFGGVQGLNIIINLVRNKLVALILGAGGMGLVSLFNSVITFISQATNLGISTSAVKNISEYYALGDHDKITHFIKVARSWSLFTAIVGMLLCAAGGQLLSQYIFSWGDHTWQFVALSPVVAMLAITGGETAILKGTRCLRSLTLIQIASVVAALVISVPVYYYFGETGIVPVIVLTALATMLVTLYYSYRKFPLRIGMSGSIVSEGMGMVKLGVAFILSGIMGSGAEMLIRSFLNGYGDEMVGLYNAGFVIVVTYAGMVFSSMETDFFPRLSSANHDTEATNLIVNRQIEVSVLIVSPLLVLLVIMLPVLIPLFYSNSFLPVVGMAQVAVLSMFVKAFVLPIEYINLAKGKAVAYLALECFFDVALVALVVTGFSFWGLLGTGIALDVAYLLDFVVVLLYTRIYYGYRPTGAVLTYAAVHLALTLTAIALTAVDNRLIYWVVGAFVFILSLSYSVGILHTKTALWTKLTEKIKSKWRHG